MEQEQPSGDSLAQEQDVGAASNGQQDQELEAEGLENEQPDAEEDELEEDLDGLKVRGKKGDIERLKAERLMQADYTRKTQEVAAQRKAIEAERERTEQVRQFDQQNLDIVADIRSIDREFAQLQQINLQQLHEQDPLQVQKVMLRMQQLQSIRGQAAGALAQRQQQFSQWQQQEAARSLDEGKAVLQREIPGWGPDLAAKLVEYGKSRGYSESQLANVTTPNFVIDLFRSYQFDTARKQATQRKAPVQEKPVTRVNTTSKARGSMDPDSMSVEEWTKWRNSQVRARR